MKEQDIFVVIVLVFVLVVFGGGIGMMSFGNPYMYGMMNGFYGSSLIFTLLFIIILVLVILWLVKQLRERK